MTDEENIRIVAHSICENVAAMNSRLQQQQQLQHPPPALSSVNMSRAHSVNLIWDDFLAGYIHDGRMSVVRRFFCLFVTFDLFFIGLLWLICIVVTGDNIYNSLKDQVVHYSIYKSLFDIVMAAICRFVVLLLFYALLYINHWFIIFLSTTGSCAFLVTKVFYYNWASSQQPVFEVILILSSFILAWGEAWFLDCRVFPQERYARTYFSGNTQPPTDRSPLIEPLLQPAAAPGSVSVNFYSPFESDSEDDEQDDEYRKKGIECVRKAYDLLRCTDWKCEKVTSQGDTIQSINREKLGKIYRLTARIQYPAKPLLEELFYKIEDVPKWNPTLLESKIVRKIDTHTDITYQATTGGGGGMVKSRDFLNLRCWRTCQNGEVIESSDDEADEDNDKSQAEGSVSSIVTSGDETSLLRNDPEMGYGKRFTETNSYEQTKNEKSTAFDSLSKSLGANNFQSSALNTEPPPLDDEFLDAVDTTRQKAETDSADNFDKIYISAAISINYPGFPKSTQYIRGENLVSCWAMREIKGKPDACIFEWLLCLDLKGYIPRYVVDTAYTTLMQDYMTHLRRYCKELRRKSSKVPKKKTNK